jgi:D-alanyl-D-alanine carboxypeptidase
MYKKYLFLLPCCFCLFILASCRKTEEPFPNLETQIQLMLAQHLEKYKKDFPDKQIGFGMYIKGSGEWYSAAGFPESMGQNIHFRGASTTKTFTAAAILRLYQLGKINIDDVITANIPGKNETYLPLTSDYNIPNKNLITIRLLLQHRAGVFDVTNSDIPASASAPYAGKRYIDYVYEQLGDQHTFTFQELIGVVASNQLSYFTPGSAFHYSNTGYNILATIIERVSGKSYDQYIHDEFLSPLKLAQTRFPYLGSDQSLTSPYLPGWLKYNNQISEFDIDNLSAAVSEGNINTTPHDLALWAYNLYGTETILNKAIQQQMYAVLPSYDVNVNYGLGTVHYPEDLGYGHDGVRPAFMTIMRYEPDSKIAIVLFSNFLNFDKAKDQNDEMHDMVREALMIIQTKK